MGILRFLRDYSIVPMFATFVVTIAFAFWPARKRRFEQDARIPLRDDR